MSKVINLRRTRKAKARDEKRAKSNLNPGTADKSAVKRLDEAKHDGHKLTRDDD